MDILDELESINPNDSTNEVIEDSQYDTHSFEFLLSVNLKSHGAEVIRPLIDYIFSSCPFCSGFQSFEWNSVNEMDTNVCVSFDFGGARYMLPVYRLLSGINRLRDNNSDKLFEPFSENSGPFKRFDMISINRITIERKTDSLSVKIFDKNEYSANFRYVDTCIMLTERYGNPEDSKWLHHQIDMKKISDMFLYSGRYSKHFFRRKGEVEHIFNISDPLYSTTRTLSVIGRDWTDLLAKLKFFADAAPHLYQAAHETEMNELCLKGHMQWMFYPTSYALDDTFQIHFVEKKCEKYAPVVRDFTPDKIRMVKEYSEYKKNRKPLGFVDEFIDDIWFLERFVNALKVR